MGSNALDFEKLDADWSLSAGGGIWRTKVPGGWLVIYDYSNQGGLTFVPDEEYEWEIE
ncbi:MAG: hypothetical protein ABEH43_11810 [Flavobacteriales bacterium]